MANINPNGGAKYWFDGDSASAIDNGTPVGDLGAPGVRPPTNNWVGSTNYWYRGTPQGFLQGGGPDSVQNITMGETDPTPPTRSRSRAYAIIL